MEQAQLDKLRDWFEGFVSGFYGEDEYVNANLKMKQEHSRRTCEEMLYLVEQLDLDEGQRRIAEAVALVHDVGRFEQFVEHGTYNDAKSLDHNRLGVEVLEREGVLDVLDDVERRCILGAVQYHGCKELPSGVKEPVALYAKLIRDADKLDALYVFTQNLINYSNDPEGFKLEVEFPDVPQYSECVLENVLGGRRVDYRELRTLNEMKLCLVCWVYDVNFAATLRRIRERRLLETIFDFLPDDENMKKVKETIFEFVEARIETDSIGLKP